MTELYLVKTSELEIDETILFTFPKERQKRIRQALKVEKAKQLYASTLLLKRVLNRYEKTLEDVKIDSFGKPYISGMYFNSSHSGSYVALAISAEEVGVDIQEQASISPMAAQLFLGENHEDSTYIWCRKEAFLKCVGCGWNDKDASCQSVMNSEIVYQNSSYFLRDINVLENYNLSICEKNKRHDFSIKEVSKNELSNPNFIENERKK